MQLRLTAVCAAVAMVICTAAQADEATGGGMMGPAHMAPVETVLCPTNVKVVLQPTPAPATGWSTNNSPVSLTADPKNLPRVESGEMICYYAMPDGYNAFVYFQGLAGRTCTVRADHTGFECHH